MDKKIFEIFGPSGWENKLKDYLKSKYAFIEKDYGLIRGKSRIAFITGLDEPLFSVVGKEDRGYRIRPEITGILENEKGEKGFSLNGFLQFPFDHVLERTTPLRKTFWFSGTENQIAGSNAGYRILISLLVESDYPVILLPQTLFSIPYTLLPLIESGIKLIVYLIPLKTDILGEPPYIILKAKNYILPENFRDTELPQKIVDIPIPSLHYNNYMDATIIPIVAPFLTNNNESLIFKKQLENFKILLRRIYEIYENEKKN